MLYMILPKYIYISKKTTNLMQITKLIKIVIYLEQKEYYSSSSPCNYLFLCVRATQSDDQTN